MKFIILIALVFALASAGPVDNKKQEKQADEKKPAEKPEEKKPEEKKDEDRKGLQWPMPDPDNEGDLMLHGVHFFDRVAELRKAKLDNDVDKMVLSVGRDYLRRVNKYLETTPEFKVEKVLCKDSIALRNSSRRWEIRIKPEHQQPLENQEQQAEATKQNDTPTKQNDPAPVKSPKTKPVVEEQKVAPSNLTNENVTDAPIVKPSRDTYEEKRIEFNERMGSNFARLLLRKYRKEKLIDEETKYLDQWLEEESIHFGVMAIYCHDGENIKETIKHITTFIDEKQQ